MKQHIIYRILTLVAGLCTIAFIVLTVIALIPQSRETGLAVKETVFVSSSALEKDSTKYVSQIQGALVNTSDAEITVDTLKIKVSDGRNTREIVLDGFKLPPRVTYPILYEWKDSYYFSRVSAVIATSDGTEEYLSNLTAQDPFDLSALIFLVPAALFALLTIHFGKECYYLIQEDQIRKNLAACGKDANGAPSDDGSQDA